MTEHEDDEEDHGTVPEEFRKILADFSFQGSASMRTNSDQAYNALTRTPEAEKSPRKSSSTHRTSDPSSIVRYSSSPRVKRGFAPPERYSHMSALQDYLADDLDIVFCGINPGLKSAEIGHHFGGPTNHFWPCLFESGLTTERLQPTEDHTLPERFSIGITNLVERPTAEQNELSRAEQIAAVPTLVAKIAQCRPRIVCFVGLGITEIVKSQTIPKSPRKDKKPAVSYGLQPFKLNYGDRGELGLDLPFKLQSILDRDSPHPETLFFSVASTSGRVVRYQKTHKVEQFKELKLLLDRVKAAQIDTADLLPIQLSQ